MGNSNNSSVCLQALVLMAVPLMRSAEKHSPRTGPGAKPEIPDWVMGMLVMTAVLKRKKSKSAQYRWLSEHRRDLTAWMGETRFPSRSTFFRRYRRAFGLFETAIRLQGNKAIDEGVTHPRHLAVDKSLVPALGRPWHQRDRRRGKRRSGIDAEGTWGYSEHHGWVYGYSYEVVVTATPKTTVFPLLASVDSASAAEVRTLQSKLCALPQQTQTLSADSGYDANRLGETVEWTAAGRRTGRRFLCPQNPRNHSRPKKKPGGADKSRAHSRRLREARQTYLQNQRVRRIYARRSKTVEPFNSWLKALFELNERVWHRQLANNRTQILAAIFCYQLLVRFNYKKRIRNGKIKWILDRL